MSSKTRMGCRSIKNCHNLGISLLDERDQTTGMACLWSHVHQLLRRFPTQARPMSKGTHLPMRSLYQLGVDQNKGIWRGFNRRSTASQPRSQRCQSREGSVLSDTILHRGSSKHGLHHNNSQYIETWREPGPTQVYWTIADQPRTNRGFHRHCLKNELIWFVRLWTLLFWFFFAIGYHFWTQFPNKPKYKSENRISCNFTLISPLAIGDSHTVCLNREPIADQSRWRIAMEGFTIADVEIYMPFHNS